jgi:diguanylate cyclase (GGDEF)-like protein
LTWLESELARARRHHHELSLVLVKPDRFEDFAAQGSDVALEVLEAAAEVIGHELRATDIALRQSQDVFAVVLPETPAVGARVAAERVRLFLPGRLSGIGRLTVSNGVATFPNDATTNSDLIAVAERALGRAIELGGNRTVCASVDDEAPPGWTLAGASVTPAS